MEGMARRSLICAAVVAGALAVPAASQAETFASPDSGTVTINDNAKASPYPSEIKVQGGDGPIVDVNVFMNLTHDHPDDLDIALVSPSGNSTILTADNCLSTDLAGVALTFDQDATDPIPDNGSCTAGGTFRPAVGTGGGATVWPDGPSPTAADLDTFVGEDPNGQWGLFVMDDTAGQIGSIARWNISITTEAAQVAIPAGPTFGGIAGPYPSTVNVSTPDGQVITDLNLTFDSFNHTHPDDVDMVLQGPGGQAAMIMSDACGSPDMHGLQWGFSDEAAAPLGDEGGVGCFTFAVRPADYGDVENLPAPAPQGPYGTSLSVFDGLQGGDWRLWINDDDGADTGWINNWSVETTSRPASATGFTAAAVSTAEGQTATLTVTRAALADLGPATLNVDIGHSGTDAADIGSVPTQLQFARGETSKTIEIPINSDFDGEGAEDFAVSLTNPVDDALLTDATSFAVVTIAASPPDNRFTVGEVKRLPNGSATVEVKIPNPGTLATDDAGPKDLLKPIETDASNAGKQIVKVKPAKKAKRKLKRGKKVKLTAEITYTPYDGTANSAEVPVKLKRG
jgi:subtilisin-like proprotein convertase family protein